MPYQENIEMTHTKGPLEAVHAGNGSFICDATKADGESGRYLLTRHHPNRQADAILFAAAPDMLAALEMALVALERSEKDRGVRHLELVAVRAAIAKAKAVQS
jgi:hypothetical protein